MHDGFSISLVTLGDSDVLLFEFSGFLTILALAGSVHKSHVLTSQLGGCNSSYRPTAAAREVTSSFAKMLSICAANLCGKRRLQRHAPSVTAANGYLAVAMDLAAQQSITEGRPVWMAELLG
ncbi:MAG: hypothetical protein R3C29_03750 [Dehalococcoidia bacterium]